MKTTKQIITRKITLLMPKLGGSDIVFVKPIGPSPYPATFPDDSPCFQINTQKGYGMQWVREMFGCEPDEIVNT